MQAALALASHLGGGPFIYLEKSVDELIEWALLLKN